MWQGQSESQVKLEASRETASEKGLSLNYIKFLYLNYTSGRSNKSPAISETKGKIMSFKGNIFKKYVSCQVFCCLHVISSPGEAEAGGSWIRTTLDYIKRKTFP